MAARSTLDELVPRLDTNDTKKKLTVCQEILDLLQNDGAASGVDCDDLGTFVDTLVPFMQSSNFKVSQYGLDIIGALIEKLGSQGFRPYASIVTGAVIDRLGDTKEIVREKAVQVATKLLEEDVYEPQVLFERNISAFHHKNGKVREEFLLLFQNTLNVYGATSLVVSKFIPAIVDLLSDPTAGVRDAAFSTLVEIYKHIGERVRVDLQKKHQVPPAKLSVLMSKFDLARAAGELLPSAVTGVEANRGDDEEDGYSSKSKSRSSSVPAGRRRVFAPPRPPTDKDVSTSSSSSTSVRRNPSMRLPSSSSAANAGGVDEESFMQAFEEVKRVTIFNDKSLTSELAKVKDTLEKTSNDWKVRIDALQMMRALLIARADQYDDFYQYLKQLELPFQSSLKDLRSQIVREACITVAFMSQQLRHKLDRFLEALLQNIVNLIPNSAKVMSTSGIVCMRFIISNTYSARFIPILTGNLTSKSKEIRRHCCEFIQQLLHTWPSHAMEKHVGILQEAIKKGVADADPEARSFARKAYWDFAEHFRDQADALMSRLDQNHRRMLQSKGGDMSNSSSSNSLNLAGRMTSGAHSVVGYGVGGGAGISATVSGSGAHSVCGAPEVRSRQSSVTSSQENLLDRKVISAAPLARKHSGIPVYTSPLKPEEKTGISNERMTRSVSSIQFSARQVLQQKERPTRLSTPLGGNRLTAALSNGSPKQTPPARSNSAIDASAVRRASVRAQYAHRSRFAATSGTPLPAAGRPRKSSDGKPSMAGMGSTPDAGASRNGRGRSSVTHSQPGSRSTSPSSLSSYATYFGPQQVGLSSRKRIPGVTRSTGTSREASPNRFGFSSFTAAGGNKPFQVRGSGGAPFGRSSLTPDRPPVRPHLTEKILRQSREAESALADALLVSHGKSGPSRKRSVNTPFEDGSDESESSSICSEKSYPEYGRRSGDLGLRGDDIRERLYWDPLSQDIGEIIANCASTHWADRKDGLVGLQSYFRDGRMLSGTELRRVTEIFSRMFMDAHTKVFALFLDTLTELIVSHKEDLKDWLHVLTARLLSKLGADLLGSITQKIYRTLDVVRNSFPAQDHLGVMVRFLADQALTPNHKVKVAALKHLTAVVLQLRRSGSSGLVSSHHLHGNEEGMAIAKIITWTVEPKSAEVRKQAQSTLVCLYQLDEDHYGQVLQKLPQVLQDSAKAALSSSSSSSANIGSLLMTESTATLTPTSGSGSAAQSPLGSAGSPSSSSAASNNLLFGLSSNGLNNSGSLSSATTRASSQDLVDSAIGKSPMKPRTLQASPNSYLYPSSTRRSPFRAAAAEDDNTENLNPEDVRKSLRSTANAIQNYTFQSEEVKDLTTTQKDGIGSYPRKKTPGSGGLDEVDQLGDRINRLNMDDNGKVNGEKQQLTTTQESLSRAEELMSVSIEGIIEELQNVKTQSRAAERRACMTQLIRMTRDGSVQVIQDNFRHLLRLLLENLIDDVGATRALVFGVLTEMLKQDQLTPHFRGFNELIILKVLESHRDPEKDVERAAEGCAAAMAVVLPPDVVIRVLNPIIKTGDFPVNQAAIKMMTKVAERAAFKAVVVAHLDEIMPGLLKAYDNVESSVRKASVFCMVALHQLVGESLQPHLACLNGSKLKLLNLYIKRAQAQSTPASPRLTTPP